MSEQRAASPARERHWVCAQRLRERRLALGLTQREVVDRLQRYGNRTTNRTLSAMENGRGLDLGLLPELAEVLGCTTTYLLGLTSDPSAWHPGGGQTRRPGTTARPADDRAVPPVPPVGVLRPDVPRGFAAPAGERRRSGGN